MTGVLVFAKRKHLSQTNADTDTLLHTYTMLVQALATGVWYIVGVVFWLIAAVRYGVDGWHCWRMQERYRLIHSADADEVLVLCMPMGFVLLAIGGVFGLVSDSLIQSKDMDTKE